MSDQTSTTNAPEQAPPTRTRAPKGAARLEWSAVIRAYAQAHPSDPTGKGARRVMRAHFADLAKADPKNYGPRGVKRATNDRVPWPPALVSVLRTTFASDAAFLSALKGEKPRKARTRKAS